jgi:hypothetical protein
LPDDGSVYMEKVKDFDVEEMLEDIRIVTKDQDNFDDTFLRSIQIGFKKYGKLTDKQMMALKNIHRKWCREAYE